MEFIYLLLLFICAYVIATDSNSSHNSTEDGGSNKDQPFPNQWLEVPLDHFNLFDNRTWKMRYFVNDEFFRNGSPLFIEVGGEWTIDGESLQTGQVFKLAKQHHGMLVETEHRYYGKSWPISTNLTVEDFKYLQIEQALEDLAFFIDRFKASTPGLENSKVILHGCSYPGMLVTWMRLRFPHIVDISYASSAPLGVGLDYPEYFEIVRDVYANVSVSCIDTIKEGFNKTSELLKTQEGRQIVKDALRNWSCADIDDMSSLEVLKTMLGILNVQYDPIKYEEVSCLVMSMDTDDTSAFHRLIILVLLKSKDQDACEFDDDIKRKGADDDSETGNDEGAMVEALRTYASWSYQTCTEMGTFPTLNRTNSKHPFAIEATVQESLDDCVDKFGELFTEHVLQTGVERVTRRYGGKKPKVSKVVTVQGTNDPWKHLAVLEDYTSEAPVLVIQGSHCVDIKDKEDDPADLLEARQKIRDIISGWIKEI